MSRSVVLLTLVHEDAMMDTYLLPLEKVNLEALEKECTLHSHERDYEDGCLFDSLKSHALAHVKGQGMYNLDLHDYKVTALFTAYTWS